MLGEPEQLTGYRGNLGWNQLLKQLRNLIPGKNVINLYKSCEWCTLKLVLYMDIWIKLLKEHA